MKILRGVLAVVLFVLYALLVHHINTTGQISSLGAALALFPVFLMVLAYAFKNHSLKGLVLILVSSTAAWGLWPYIMRNTSYIFWLLDVGLMAVLLITFARTLKPGRKPLCVSFAEIINQGPLPPAHELYARRVTIAWALFFTMIIVVSTGLFFFAPLATWSIFVNFVTLPLVGVMFVIEYLIRRQVLNNLPEGNMLDAIRTYMHHRSSTHSAK